MTRAALAGMLLASALGCATSLDLGEMRERLAPRGPEPAPTLREEPNLELARVEGLRALSGELRAIPLRWNASPEPMVAGYVVDRAPSADGPFVYIATLGDRFQTVYVDEGRDLAPKRTPGRASGGLAHAETYHYRVRPFDRAGRVGAATPLVASGTTAAKPAPPPGLQAYSHLPRRVALRWQPAPDPNVTGYVVSRSPSPSGTYAELARIAGRHRTVYLDKGLPDLGVFYYRVASIDAAGGVGDPGSAERAVTKGEPLPPTALRIAAQTIGANELRWQPNVEPDLRAYRLYRTRAGAKEAELVAELPPDTTSATDSAVLSGERVVYRLFAIDADGLRSGASDPVETVGIDYDLRARATPRGVQLSWNAAAQASFAETRILCDGEEIGRSGSSASFLHPGGRRGDRYQVAGVRKNGSSAPLSKTATAQ